MIRNMLKYINNNNNNNMLKYIQLN